MSYKKRNYTLSSERKKALYESITPPELTVDIGQENNRENQIDFASGSTNCLGTFGSATGCVGTWGCSTLGTIGTLGTETESGTSK